MKKKIMSVLFGAVITLSMLTGCSSTVDEPCMYCNYSPSKEYKMSNGNKAYVCEDCSSECMLCGKEKATKHYESMLGVVFVCSDCYEEVKAQ